MSNSTKASTLFGAPKAKVAQPAYKEPAQTVIVDVLPPEKASMAIPISTIPTNAICPVSKVVESFNLTVVDGPAIVLFGSDRQKQIGAKLDDLLAEVTKGNSPVLFELFNKLKKGVDEADLPTLEKKIRDAQSQGGFSRFVGAIFGQSAVKRLQKANQEIEQMLASKSKSLMDLTKSMEGSLSTEVQRLVTDATKLTRLANEFRINISEFEVYVQAGREILKREKARLVDLKAKASETQTVLDIEAANIHEQKVDLFENRLLIIENILAKAPSELQSIYISQGAGLQVLGETASASLEEFNTIKSVLIKLSVNLQIGSVQTLNAERRNLMNSLEKYGNETLGNVAVNAAKQQGINRLEDATRLLENAKKLNEISNKVLEEQKNNKLRFEEARTKLLESKQMFKLENK